MIGVVFAVRGFGREAVVRCKGERISLPSQFEAVGASCIQCDGKMDVEIDKRIGAAWKAYRGQTGDCEDQVVGIDREMRFLEETVQHR